MSDEYSRSVRDYGLWQPIETAPKAPEDGPECWGIIGYWPGGHIETVYWGNGWWPTAGDAEEPWMPPTHWMPLPIDPSDDEIEAAIRKLEPAVVLERIPEGLGKP